MANPSRLRQDGGLIPLAESIRARQIVGMQRTPNSPTLPLDERQHLQRLVDEVGEPQALAITQVSREALARALAGLGVRRGTLALLRAGLAARAPADRLTA